MAALLAELSALPGWEALDRCAVGRAWDHHERAKLAAHEADSPVLHREAVVESYARLGVPEDKLNYLAIILLAGAAGVIAGLVWAPIGVVATIGVVCYFVGAVVFHLRAREFRTVSTPIAFAVVAAAALALRLTS